MAFIKKENICISDEYTDGQGNIKKLWKTIGEIATFSGDNGEFQKIKLWGPGGFTEASVLPPREDNQQQQAQQQQQGYQQQAPQQQGQQQQNYQQNNNPPY